MQITLSAEQSQILETLSQQGQYESLETAINQALLLLAAQVTEHNPDITPEYLEWLERTRLEIDVGIQAAAANDVIDADLILAQLRQKVDIAKAKSV